MNSHQLETGAKVLKALAHPIRLGILQCLAEKTHNVSELTAAIGCSQSMMSQQVAILEQQQLICCHKEGTTKYCAIKNEDFLKMLHCLEKHLSQYLQVAG
jgi:ArsR family transcriptional regulator